MTEKIEQFWNQILFTLGDILTYTAIESWIKPLCPLSLENNVLTIVTNSNLSKEWIVKNYSIQLNKVIKTVIDPKCSLDIVVDKDLKTKKSEVIQKAPTKENSSNAKKENFVPLNEFQINSLKSTSYNLNLKYNFENFVVGENNRFAREAALVTARKPGQSHNPLFIYGGAGLGKTHLMHAIGHYTLVHHQKLKIKYTTTEAFTNDLINCLIRSGTATSSKMNEFRQKYRHVDVLLLDDIQFIEGKDSTQDEIFHTFDNLYNAGKQIIITSDRAPKDIPTLTERLRSRFEWGLLADIQPPSIETRMAILRSKSEQEGLDIPYDVIELIAMSYQTNIRELEGALNKVVAYSSISGLPINIDNIRNIINVNGKNNKLTIDKIIGLTAEYFNVEPSEIKGQSRCKEISQARHIAIYLVRELKNSSFPQIGEAFGGRKHTTILYAYEKIKEEFFINKSSENAINEIKNKISQNYILI
ncbi:MAG: chromosomal replication initiator protein DnaA [Candidatus Gastranaerophilaceae bacterium]|jgi:chromosomal replication initiator protein